MEMLVIIGLCVFVSLLVPWINLFRIGNTKDEIERLRNRIYELEGRIHKVEGGNTEPLTPKPLTRAMEQERAQIIEECEKNDILSEELAEAVFKEVEEPVQDIASEPHYVPVAGAEKEKSNFEFNIAAKLPVWIGSISLIFAAFFLVKYSIEFGLLGPLTRVSLGALFGVSLLGAGHFIANRPQIANSTRISQGVIGAGLVALYVSIYASINLYDLIPELIGFGAMSIVTALAVIMSLRHGQPIAVFGLLGGLLTPALVGSDAPNAMALFTYLFVLYGALFTVLIRKGWWLLSIVALWGVFSWSALWFVTVFSPADAFVLILFAMGITAVVLSATGKRIADGNLLEDEKFSVHALNSSAIAGGVITIIWLSFKMTLSLFDWSMLGLLSLALMTLAYFKPDIYQKALIIKLGASLLLLASWATQVPLTESLVVIGGMGVIYIGGGAFLMRQTADPRFWAGLQCATAFMLYLIGYWTLDLPLWIDTSFGIFWGILSLILASVTIYQAAAIRLNYQADQTIQDHLVAVYAFTASAFITLGIVIELPLAQMPLAIAAQIAATVWIYQRSGIVFLQKIIYILSLIFVALNYEQILLFGSIIVHSLLGDVPSDRGFGKLILDAPLLNLGVPAALFYASLSICMKIDKTNEKLIHAHFAIANILTLFTAYYLFRDFFHVGAGNIFSSELGFIERGLVTFTLAGVAIGMFEYVRKKDVTFLRPWAAGIFRMAIFRFVYFDFLMYNPYFADDQFVGHMPLLNGITMTYGLGLIASIWALKNKELIMTKESMHKTYALITLASIFALVTLNIRQYFHAPFLDHGRVDSVELYSYSVAWLLTGLALLGAGIKLSSKPLRMASLAFIALVVCKVFLIDAAALEGLYRVFSFFGLGISLIGLSFFYTRFVAGSDQQEDNHA
ncbi:MAG: hypothetical protein CBB87_01500 [Micavibrio sp. TMED27]|nr:hypothetical protein [Micavibrio sp.]OUT92444.1 MAG: hypothetical protein CBB87_01500 [Micavibrio sp. TMED27]